MSPSDSARVLGEPAEKAAEEAASQVTALADAYVEAYFDAFPEHAVSRGAPDRRPDELADNSLEAIGSWHEREDAMLAALRALDLASIEGRPEAVTYKFLQNELESSIRFRACRMELWNVSPTWSGWQHRLPLLARRLPVETAEARRNAFGRISRLPKVLETEIENLTEGLRLGYSAPAGNVRLVIEQMDAMLSSPVETSLFVQMAGDDSPEFRDQLMVLETDAIRPAVAKYREFLATTYLSKARAEVGVSANPNGAEGYRAAIRYRTTVERTPEEIHKVGLEQMEVLEDRMRRIGERAFGVSEPAELLELVKSDPKYRFASREELIAAAETAVERARLAMPRAFGRLPKVGVVVEPYPERLEKSAPGGQYSGPSADGKPGRYLLNAFRASERSRAGLESTAFHETYPGHHLQVALAHEREDLHPISRHFFLSGFGEGWALYAERLADELGLFSADIDRLGLLSAEAFRAGRLVVDSGLHALGWTRERAIDYLVSHTALTTAQGAREIDRYSAVPGHATAYMIGSLEIRRLREDAESRLGEGFDRRVFHDLLLEDGNVPLRVLGEKVERWVSGRSERANGLESCPPLQADAVV